MNRIRPADIVFERIQRLSKKEFALGGPMDIAPRTSENIISARKFMNNKG